MVLMLQSRAQPLHGHHMLAVWLLVDVFDVMTTGLGTCNVTWIDW